jgi:hypothetical protein
MAYSTIPAAKAQLVDTTLPARAGLAGVLIAWGIPMDEPSANRERVYVGDATSIQREWAQLGRYRVDEDYMLPIYVEVYQEGDAQRTCEERMWAIVAEIEQAAVVDIALAGTLKWGVKPGPMDPKAFPYGDGWIAQVTVSLECSSRLQAT